MQDNSDREPWTAVVQLIDQAIASIAEAARILSTLAEGEPLALEAKRAEADVTVLGLRAQRARAGLN